MRETCAAGSSANFPSSFPLHMAQNLRGLFAFPRRRRHCLAVQKERVLNKPADCKVHCLRIFSLVQPLGAQLAEQRRQRNRKCCSQNATFQLQAWPLNGVKNISRLFHFPPNGVPGAQPPLRYDCARAEGLNTTTFRPCRRMIQQKGFFRRMQQRR